MFYIFYLISKKMIRDINIAYITARGSRWNSAKNFMRHISPPGSFVDALINNNEKNKTSNSSERQSMYNNYCQCQFCFWGRKYSENVRLKLAPNFAPSVAIAWPNSWKSPEIEYSTSADCLFDNTDFGWLCRLECFPAVDRLERRNSSVSSETWGVLWISLPVSSVWSDRWVDWNGSNGWYR